MVIPHDTVTPAPYPQTLCTPIRSVNSFQNFIMFYLVLHLLPRAGVMTGEDNRLIAGDN